MKKKKEKSINLPKINVTTSIPYDEHKLARDNKISWNDALSIGIRFLLAERDSETYNYPECKLKTRVSEYVVLIKEQGNEIEKLKEELKNDNTK